MLIDCTGQCMRHKYQRGELTVTYNTNSISAQTWRTLLRVSGPESSRSVQDSDIFWQGWQSFHWEAKDYPSRARQNLRQFISQFLHSAPPLPHWEAYSTTGEYWLHRRCRQRAESIYVVENLSSCTAYGPILATTTRCHMCALAYTEANLLAYRSNYNCLMTLNCKTYYHSLPRSYLIRRDGNASKRISTGWPGIVEQR